MFHKTSVDSIMLVESGFEVTSVDASDKMLKYALKERWNRRNEKGFDKWGNFTSKLKRQTIFFIMENIICLYSQ